MLGPSLDTSLDPQSLLSRRPVLAMQPGATLEVPGQGTITTYEAAAKEEFNVIRRLGHAPAVQSLADDVWRQRESIEALTRQHLGLAKHDRCTVLERRQWIRGGFNLCV